MKKLLILSGKGGTGKTTTAAAFIEFGKIKAFADCDVDAPNLHLITGNDGTFETFDYYGSMKSTIDPDKCTNCGACANNCRFDAIHQNGDHYEVDEFACEGCCVCTLSCKYDAVKMVPDVAGEQMLLKNDVVFSTAKLKMGRGNSGKLVTAVKTTLTDHAPDTEIAVIDGSPGIGCPVIASIAGVDMVLVVAEPSHSGISDMKRVLKTASLAGVKSAVCVNKADASPENTDIIEAYCLGNNIPFVGKIPYDKHVSQAINEGHSIVGVDCPARSALQCVYQSTIQRLQEAN